MSNGQDKKKTSKSAHAIFQSLNTSYWAEQDRISETKDGVVANDGKLLHGGGKPRVDDVLKSLYGPISAYVNKDNMYSDYSKVYESGFNESKRNLSGFDPIDYAKAKGIGSNYMRQQALRSGRLKTYEQADDMFGYPVQTGYGEPWIPGHQEWSSSKNTYGQPLNPNTMEDYFYDLAFQEVLKGQVEIGHASQGTSMWKKGNTSNTQNNLRQLKNLVGEDNYSDVIDDISSKSLVKARDWVTDYRETSKGKMQTAITSVQKRQDVLTQKENIQDLNEVIIRKQQLDDTNSSLDSLSSKDITGEAKAILEKTTVILNKKIKKAMLNPSPIAEDVWRNFANSGDYSSRGGREISVLNSMIKDEQDRMSRSSSGVNEYALFESGGRLRSQRKIDDYKSWIKDYKKSGTSERKKSFKY